MDKNIIIDCADCEFNKYPGECWAHPITDYTGEIKGYKKCKDIDCYYKRLQIAEADIDRLEQENKELKEMLSKEPKAMQAFQTAYSGLKKDNEVLWGMVKDYKTTLEKIKEDMDQDTTCESRECGCDDNAECLNCIKETILNKINEVLE